MNDILIRGMEMPKDGFINIIINSRGQVWESGSFLASNAIAKELPPHGDLIDRNATIEESEKPTIFDLTDVSDFLHEQPVVIPSNKENKNAN